MKNINTYLTGKYHLSKYQVAQVVFLLKTIKQATDYGNIIS